MTIWFSFDDRNYLVLQIVQIYATIEINACNRANFMHATSQQDFVELFGEFQIGDL